MVSLQFFEAPAQVFIFLEDFLGGPIGLRLWRDLRQVTLLPSPQGWSRNADLPGQFSQRSSADQQFDSPTAKSLIGNSSPSAL